MTDFQAGDRIEATGVNGLGDLLPRGVQGTVVSMRSDGIVRPTRVILIKWDSHEKAQTLDYWEHNQSFESRFEIIGEPNDWDELIELN